jgi:hypothetical protein
MLHRNKNIFLGTNLKTTAVRVFNPDKKIGAGLAETLTVA